MRKLREGEKKRIERGTGKRREENRKSGKKRG